VFFLTYMLAELRRRRGRTILTALGLGVGVALVVVVNAVSTGLDDAQQQVLAPLTGVGTDMSVTRPIEITSDGQGAFGNLSPAEQQRLRRQRGNGPALNLRDRKPGSTFSTDTFTATSRLSFSAAQVARVSKIDGVAGAAGVLTLTAAHVYGTVPDIDITQAPGAGGPRGGGGAAQGSFGSNSIHFDTRSVTGVDQTQSSLAPVAPSQVVEGSYFSETGKPYQAIVSSSFAATKKLDVGDSISLGGRSFHIIGLASSPLGGTATDAYVKLATLQKLAGYKGQINAIQVRATDTGAVPGVASAIEASFAKSQVTTAADLASRVGGSLADAKDLSSKLGRALEIVGLLAAVLIASLLTLSSVAKRVRELGTLKALGWSRWTVVRQVSGESVLQGLLGGVIGAAIAVVGVLIVNSIGWTLEATVGGSSSGDAAATAANAAGPPGGPGGAFGLGQAAINSGSSVVKIVTTPDLGLVLLAIGLAVAGGLVAGAVGGLRAARLRPAAALRTVE
jgi:putative ABC transport system permease protein